MFTDNHSISVFRKLVFASVLLIYLVIAAGGIVRSTGSGMGCPDWPKCFGMWVPPTDLKELPLDYKIKFKVGNHYIADFNVFKTWIEYVNRLLGVLVGISVFVTAVYSFRFLRTKPFLLYISVIIVLLTGIQGYIGAKVVSSNLSEYMITIHMLIALVIMSLSLYLLSLTEFKSSNVNGRYSSIMFWLSLFTLIQILVGTQVRQQIDTISYNFNYLNRGNWISQLQSIYIIHRILAVLLVIVNIWFSFIFLKKFGSKNLLGKLSLSIVGILSFEYLAGVIMARLSIPALIQPVHLLLATLLFGLQFYSWLISRLHVEKNIYSLNA